jgi:cobalt-zinc-cadmium efflux system protein
MHHTGSKDSHSANQILTAFVLNSAFALIEIAGAFLTNSVSILADALHDLGDSLALGFAWYFERISRRGRDSRHSYGYRRYTVVGAIVNAIVLITGSLLIVREAVLRLSATEPVHGPGMIFLAILGILVNGYAFSRLHGGHSHNVSVVRLHLLEDVLGWVVVLIGAIMIQIWSLYILDPLLSIAVSAWILFMVVKRLRSTLRIILQNTPGDINTDSINNNIRTIPGVRDTHDIHLWTMDGVYHVLTIHVVVDRQKSMSELASLKDEIRKQLAQFQIRHATIEFEYPEEACALIEC